MLLTPMIFISIKSLIYLIETSVLKLNDNLRDSITHNKLHQIVFAFGSIVLKFKISLKEIRNKKLPEN
jgi:hypothetical protein